MHDNLQQAIKIADRIQEICNEKLECSKNEHIFIEQGLNQIKQIIADLATEDKPEEK